MYTKPKHTKTSIIVTRKPVQGEPISRKVQRITQNKEPIKDGADIIYNEREDGVEPQHDIRTDRFEIATEAMDKKHNYNFGKREERLKAKQAKKDEKDNKSEPGETGKTGGENNGATAGGTENPTA